MSNDRGVFTLSAYRRAQVEGQGVNLDDVWLPHAPTSLTNYGYFSSGYNGSSPGITSRTDRTNFTTDTTVNLPASPISAGQKDGATLTSLTHMYAAGGWDAQTRVYKMNYASETWVNAPGHPGMVREQRQTGNNAVGPKTTGYIFMGDDPNYPGPQHSTVQKILYSVDTWSQLPNYPYSSIYSMGAGNQTRGIISGGNKSNGDSKTSESYKFTFSDETYASVPGMSANASGPGNGERSESAAAGNDEYHWISGGRMPHGMTTSSIKYTYSTDSWERTPGISRSRRYLQAAGNTTQGYWAGGDSPSPAYSTVDKISYATDTATAAPGANLTEARSKQFATSPRMNGLESPTTPGVAPYRWKDGFQADDLKAGYYQGGGNPSSNSATQKVSYISDQTSLVPGGSLPQNGSVFAGVNSNSTKAILSGGEPGGEAFMKFVYTTETSSNLAGSMPSRRNYNNDMGYGTESVGYVTGGGSEPSNPGFYYSSTQKVEYATDTTSDVPGANSNQPLAWMAAFGNVDHTTGYITGGLIKSPTAAVSRIQKMTYSTETIANTPANMHNNYFNLGTSSGPDSAYLYSQQEYPGYTAGGNIQKFVYATDSRTTIPQPSYYPTYGANGTGNSSNGYYGGGYSPSSPGHRFTRILKLSFSTGVGQDLPSSQFANPGVYRSAASSAVARKKSPKGAPVPTPTSSTSPVDGLAPNFGVAGGGNRPGVGTYTLFDKLTYSTETNSTLPSSDATIGTNSYTQRSVTSQTEGWSNSAGGTHLWKFVYSTSTQNPSPASHTTRNYADGFTFSNKTEGYFGGGANVGSPGPSYSGGPSESLDKFTFSTSTASQVPDVAGSPSNYKWYYQTSNVGNQQAGYWSGGSSRSMGKYVYATSTSTMTNNKLTADTQKAAGAGNATYGYFIAGDRSTTDRLEYSTDTLISITSASYPPGDQTTGAASHSSSDAGYIQSGRSPSAPNSPFNYHWSNTRKITYSTSTMSELPASANVNMGRNDYSGMSARQNNNGSAAPSPNLV